MEGEMEDAEKEDLGNIYGFRDNDILKLDNHRCCSALPLLIPRQQKIMNTINKLQDILFHFRN